MNKGKRRGKGKMTYRDLVCEGGWKDDKRHGMDKRTFANGRFLARARAIFSRNRMNVRPISVEGGFAMISRHEGLDLGRSEL